MTSTDKFVIPHLEDAIKADLTMREAAEKLGVSYSFVRVLSKRHSLVWPDGRERFNGGPTGFEVSARTDDIMARWDAGETLKSIGDDYGITRERVRQIVMKAGGKSGRKRMDEAHAAIAALLSERPMTATEAMAEIGSSRAVVLGVAKKFGVKVEKRPAELTAHLKRLSDRVAAGESFRSAAGTDPVLASMLARYCRDNSIVSQAPTRWSCNHEARRKIIAEGRAAGKAFSQMAVEIAAVEGVRTMSPIAIQNWVYRCAPDLLAVKTPKARPDKRRLNGKARHKLVQMRNVCAPASIVVKETVRETALANRGNASAGQIARAIGVTRNCIIGHWFRARSAGMIA